MAPATSADLLAASIADSGDILALATAWLRLCRDELPALVQADAEPRTWRARDAVRRQAELLFEEVDDIELDDGERARLAELAVRAQAGLPAVLVARLLAEALDAALGDRLLPMFLNRRVALHDGAPMPTPRPDWRRLTPSPNSDPWSLDGRLDALPHLRLAGPWAREVAVELDGGWRTWSVIPRQLAPGDRLGCALPNQSLADLRWERATVEGRPVFYGVRPRAGDADQIARCRALLEGARRAGCRVVVLPELSASAALVDDIAAWLDGQRTVELVVAGSRHVQDAAGAWHNQAEVLVRGAGWRLSHRKFRPYSFLDAPDGHVDGARIDRAARVRRLEHLALGTPQLRAWLSPSWIMAVLICKDLVQQPVPHLLGELRANLVLVPCLSFKMDAFRTAAADVATWAQGVAVIANGALLDTLGGGRPPVVVGVPTQTGSVLEACPPADRPTLMVVTLGNPSDPARLEVMPEM